MFRLLVEVILVLLVEIVKLAVLVLQWLPRMLAFVRDAAQVALVISCYVYRAVINQIRPLGRRVGINLVANPLRSVVCVLLSMALGAIIMLVAGWEITPPRLGLSALHGLLVGLVWDQVGPPKGISLGI